MSKDNEWTPLNDLWDSYSSKIKQDRSLSPLGMTEEDFEAILWPELLYVGHDELEDAKKFVENRTEEMLKLFYFYKGVHPEVVASFITRSLIAGMLWQQDRIG